MQCAKLKADLQGRIHDFQIEGGAKDYDASSAHPEHEAWSPLITAEVWKLYRVLDAAFLALFLSILIQNYVPKQDKQKHIVDQNIEGARTCCAPAWIRRWIWILITETSLKLEIRLQANG